LIYYLENPNRGGRLINLLDTSQVTVVRRFLEWVLKNSRLWPLHSNAKAAVDSIWSEELEQ
jgi:hypothetical protein